MAVITKRKNVSKTKHFRTKKNSKSFKKNRMGTRKIKGGVRDNVFNLKNYNYNSKLLKIIGFIEKNRGYKGYTHSYKKYIDSEFNNLNNDKLFKIMYNAYIDLAMDYFSKGNIKASKDYFTRAFELEIKHVVKYMLIEEAIKQKVTVDTLKQNNPNIETQFLNHTRNRIQIRDANREASARKKQE